MSERDTIQTPHTRSDASLLSDDPTSADGTEQKTGVTFAGEELVLGYSETDPVIEDESIVIPPGEVTALVGPNGSGKSTLLKGLADQLPLDSGSVILDGREIQRLKSKDLARRLGLLSQENVAPGSIDVKELVYHGRYPHRGFFDRVNEEDERAVEEAIALAGINHLRGREVSTLSGGQKQLVWIAMVLAQETDVLLLDEPTTFLDLHHQLEVMEIIRTLQEESEITVLLVLHDIDQAARYANYIFALKDGAIHAHGSPEEVVTEKLLAEVFRVDATVKQEADGPRITPHGPLHD